MNSNFILGVGIIAIVLIFITTTHNKVVMRKNEIIEIFYDIDKYMGERQKVAVGIAENLKGNTPYEKSIIKEVEESGLESFNLLSPSDKIKRNKHVSNQLQNLLDIKEETPEEELGEDFQELMEELEFANDALEDAVNSFNRRAKEFNIFIAKYPYKILARMMNMQPIPPFGELENDEE